jgi:hypothetical protein
MEEAVDAAREDLVKVTAAVEPLQAGFRANGGELQVVAVDGDLARLRLVFEPDACLDCILAGEVLEGVLLQTIRASLPVITRIEVADPRGAMQTGV